jgi:tight adherence protein B
LPDALEDIARGLRSGTSLLRAIEDASEELTVQPRAGPSRVPSAGGRWHYLPSDARDGPNPAAARAESSARTALADLAAHARRGVPLASAATRWADTAVGRGDGADIALAGIALALAADGGPNAARALDGVAATLRERRAAAADAAVQSAQARLSAIVIALLPLAFALWSVLADPRVAGFLVTTPAGLLCLSAGLMLDGIGVWWMTRLLRSVR